MSPLQRFPSLLLETVILGIVINSHAAKLKGIDLWIHISYFKKVPLSNRTPQSTGDLQTTSGPTTTWTRSKRQVK